MSWASASSLAALLVNRIRRTCRLYEYRPDGRHRQVEMVCVVLHRDETVLLVEALRIVVLGEQVHREHADPLRHVAGRFQKVEEKQLTQTLASAGQIDGQTTQ